MNHTHLWGPFLRSEVHGYGTARVCKYGYPLSEIIR